MLGADLLKLATTPKKPSDNHRMCSSDQPHKDAGDLRLVGGFVCWLAIVVLWTCCLQGEVRMQTPIFECSTHTLPLAGRGEHFQASVMIMYWQLKGLWLIIVVMSLKSTFGQGLLLNREAS